VPTTAGETAPVRVRVVDAASDRRWDAFVRDHPDAGAYQLSAWSRVLAKAYGYAPRYLAVEQDGRLDGVLPLMASVGVFSGKRLRSLPVVGSTGPLARTGEGYAALLEAACRLTEASGSRSWTLHARRGGYDELVPRLRPAGEFKTWVAPLPDDADALRAGWKKSQNNLWRSLRKSERAGVTARMTDSERDLRRFYRLYEENVRRHRSLPYSWRLFALTREHLGPSGVYRLVVAEYEGEIVAGAVLNAFRGNIDLVYNASSSRHLDVRPNHAVYWHAISWGIANGYRTYTMGQAPPGGSLARFKAQWGGEPVDRFRFVYRPGEAAAAPSASQALRAASNRLDTGEERESRSAQAWSRAPLPLLRAAGELAYRFF
jgi:hypothetical protein